VKETKIITLDIINLEHVWLCKKGMDDLFYVQGVLLVFYQVNPWWHIPIYSPFIDPKWAWFTCHSKSIEHASIWLEYGHFAFPHLSCITIFRCELFHAIQVCFQERKRQ
jgi:hypothetical protein